VCRGKAGAAIGEGEGSQSSSHRAARQLTGKAMWSSLEPGALPRGRNAGCYTWQHQTPEPWQSLPPQDPYPRFELPGSPGVPFARRRSRSLPHPNPATGGCCASAYILPAGAATPGIEPAAWRGRTGFRPRRAGRETVRLADACRRAEGPADHPAWPSREHWRQEPTCPNGDARRLRRADFMAFSIAFPAASTWRRSLRERWAMSRNPGGHSPKSSSTSRRQASTTTRFRLALRRTATASRALRRGAGR